jgi:primosomal protein N' (replication factor Y)
MVSKGLDLPKVSLVGIVQAEVGLDLPDPFSAERVFQTLTHAAGRAGRSKAGGQVVLQTYVPDHYVIRCAAVHDTESFYSEELAQRRRLGYPPFTRLLRLEYRHRDAARAEQAAASLAGELARRVASGGSAAAQQRPEGSRSFAPETAVIGTCPLLLRACGLDVSMADRSAGSRSRHNATETDAAGLAD